MESLSDAMSKLAQKNPTVVARPTVPGLVGGPTVEGVAGGPSLNADGEPLRVRVVAPKGTELVANHPARLAKKD